MKKRNFRLKAILYTILISQLAHAESHEKANAQIRHQEISPRSDFFLYKLFNFKSKKEDKKAAPDGPQFAGCSKTVDRNSNVTTKRFIDARYLDQVFKGKLKGQGKNIILTANKYGIDPVFFAAIMAQETGWGTSSKVKIQNNPGGIFRNKKYVSFPTIEKGIDFMAANLKNRYVDKNILTITKVAGVYAPVGAKNDPKGRNKLWPGGVTNIMNKIIKGSLNMGNDANVRVARK